MSHEDEDMKKAIERTLFIQSTYTMAKGVAGPASSDLTVTKSQDKDKLKNRKKNILGIDLENGRTDEKIPLKNHTTIEHSDDKNSGSSRNLDSIRKNFKIDLIAQDQADDNDEEKVLDNSKGSQVPPTNSYKERILSLEELIESPTKDEPGLGISPKFRFRSIRSGGNTLVFNRGTGGSDPVSIFQSLVAAVYQGGRLQTVASRYLVQSV